MAGNTHEGLGDEFFEQILAAPPGSYPPMALQLGSGGGVGGGIGGMLPMGLNLEQSGSVFRDDVVGNSSSNSLLNSWQMESGLVHNMSGGLFPAYGQLQPPPLRMPPPLPLPLSQPGPAIHQSFQSQQPSGSVSTLPNPPAMRPRIRARRGQATDPHSIAERLRRERIAERMKALQELVPSCNKTDRAAMLDEVVDYVKFLRLQVKVLSMSRLGGAGAVAQLVSDVPLSSIEGESVDGGTYPPAWDKWSDDGTEQQVAKLMEEDVGAAMQFLQSKALCIMPISLASTIFHTSPPDPQLIMKPESNNMNPN